MGLRGGDLDRRIIIESKAVVQDAYGDDTLTWSTFLTVWSDFFQEKGKEITDNDNRTTERPIVFVTRYHSTIENDMRIQFESRWYKIEDIKEIKVQGRQSGLRIMTSLLTQT